MRPGQPLHELVKERLLSRLRLARRHAETRHAALDTCNALWRNYADPQELDEQGRQTNPFPRSVVVPFSYAAVQTLVSYWFAAYTSRPAMIPIMSWDPQYDRAAEAAEAVLEAKLQLDMSEVKIWQWLMDAARYGQGRMHTTWVAEHEEVVEEYSLPLLQMFGFTAGTQRVERLTWRVRREGPVNTVIDPYTYLPDPRVSSTDPQQGEFVAYECWLPYDRLVAQQEDGQYINLGYIPQQSSETIASRRTGSPKEYELSREKADPNDRGYLRVDVAYVRLIPADWKAGGFALGDSTRPEVWLLAIADDQTVIQAKPFNGAGGGVFPIAVIDTNYDAHNLWNPSDIETVEGLQRYMNWLYNSRAANLRAGLFHALAYDPEYVHEDDAWTVEPGLRIRVSTGGRPISQVISQLPWIDVTKPLQNEVVEGGELIKLALGATDPLQGVHESGSGTAAEAAMLLGRAQSRAGARARLMWQQGFVPWAKMMLCDLQANLSEEKFYRIVGDAARHWRDLQQGRARVGPELIQGDLDIAPADPTLPLNKDKLAALWGQLAMFVAKDPILSQQFDHVEMFEEFARLSGIQNIEDFVRQQPDPAQFQALLAASGAPGGGGPPAVMPRVVPDEVALQQAQRGNIVPVAGDGQPEGSFIEQLLRQAQRVPAR